MARAERELLIRLFQAGLDAVDPATCLPAFLPVAPPMGRTFVGGAGKAAARMAAVLSDHLDGTPLSGAVVTRYGHGLKSGEFAPGIEILEAGHPVPDEASVAAGSRLLQLARAAQSDDRFIFLLSGGASSLLVQPAPGLTLADKQSVTRQLLVSGASIGELNAVRRKLSAIKGGGLARACRAREILVLAISDVPGDAVADIGSGPLSPDPVSRVAAREIVERYRIECAPAVIQALAGEDQAAPAAGLERVTTRVIARSADALAAAACAAEAAGWPVLVVPDVRGPAREAARAHAALIRDLRQKGRRSVVISGGETTTAVTATAGRGGRNGEYLLALALALGPDAGVHALAADTDGLDGTGDNAGAFLDPETLRRAGTVGLDVAGCLAGQCSYNFFAQLGDLLVTGPTRTNVNDLRITLVN